MSSDLHDAAIWQTLLIEIFANIVSGLVVSGIIWWVANQFFLRANLLIELTLSDVESDGNSKNAQFRLYNHGRRSFTSDLFWHVLIEDGINVTGSPNQGLTSDPTMVDIKGKKFLHMVGTMDKSLHPDRPWGILDVVLKFPNANTNYEIRWFVATDQGIFPKSLRKYARISEEKLIDNIPVLGRVSTTGWIPELK